jgi:TonB family protein
MYHGWSDAALPPLGAINYFESVQAALGRQQTDAFMRLYMAPGVQHCGGGPGANSFGQDGVPSDAQHDVHEALEQWVEKGTAPDRIIASKFTDPRDHSKGVSMTRPLCPYPQYAKYKGSGDTNDAANFECVQRVLKAGADNGQKFLEIPGVPGGSYVLTDLRAAGVTPPRALQTPEPEYSESARKKRIQGTVTLSLIVGTDGRTYKIQVVDPLEPSLDENAIEAVKTWKFAPATKDDKPVAVAMKVEVAYHLYTRP